MDNSLTRLAVQVMVDDSDAEDVARATSQLRQELLGLDVETVQAPMTLAPPPGSRSAADVVALGALAVNLTDPQVLGAVITAIKSWLTGSSRRSIKMEIGGDVLQLTGVSSHEQRRLTDEWLDRHTSGS
jgi:hypothetical protein